MNHLSKMSEDEVRFICAAIPHYVIIGYFTKNPKSFQKIHPGFRPKTVSKEDAERLLAQNVDNGFISKFLEEIIDDWLSEIEKHYSDATSKGADQITAWIDTLSKSYFSSETDLYFNLACKNLPEKEKMVISAVAGMLSKAQRKNESLSSEIQKKESMVKNLSNKLDVSKTEIEKQKGKLGKRQTEIDHLKIKLSDMEMLRKDDRQNEKEIEALKKEIVLHEQTIEKLNEKLDSKASEMDILKEQIREELEKQRIGNIERKSVTVKPKRPNGADEMDDFSDFLSANLNSIGVLRSEDYLLKNYLKSILFHGVPIVINRSVGRNIIKCVGNTINEKQDVMTLGYKTSITQMEIRSFLAQSDRVVCLDSFLGNYNEAELLTALDGYEDRIIFCTVAYDKTLRYIPIEFQEYTYYLNANRIDALSRAYRLTEDPSRILEEEYEVMHEEKENRLARILREILKELSYPHPLIEKKVSLVSSKTDLWCLLVFDILPYCIDVMHVRPFNESEKLQRYVMNPEQCHYKNLFKEWFT